MPGSVISYRKYYKRNKVLNVIRSGQDVSRYDVKKQTMYSIATVGDIIGELIDEGLVYEEDCQETRVGRKPTWLRLNPSGAFFIGVEFNAQMMYCAMLNLVGDVVWEVSEKVSSGDSGDKITKQIIRHVQAAIEAAPGGKQRVSGLCVGVPGYCDKEKGIGISYTHLNNWENVPIKETLEEYFELPCYVDSNVNLMALAFKWFYFHGDVRDYVLVSMRTGIHMVPFMDNELILSHSGFAGELGHVHVAGGSRVCSCGRYGCLNSEISSAGILNTIQEGLKVGRFKPLLALAEGQEEKITIELFCQSVLTGHEDSVQLMKRTAAVLAEALAWVVNILAPQVIILSGYLPAGLSELFVNEVQAKMEPFTVAANYKNLQVCASAFDKNLGAIGAAAMVMQEEFEFIDQPV